MNDFFTYLPPQQLTADNSMFSQKKTAPSTQLRSPSSHDRQQCLDSRCHCKCWTEAEDLKLAQMVKRYGNRWVMISYHMDRPAGHCMRRWKNILSASLLHDDWTQREDLAIFLCPKILPSQWFKVAQMLGNQRTPYMVRNRYRSGFMAANLPRFQQLLQQVIVDNGLIEAITQVKFRTKMKTRRNP